MNTRTINMKQLVKKFLPLLFFMIILTHAEAQQQTQYTQYMFNGLAINPAYAGSQKALQGSFLARWQWAGFEGSPNTQALYVDGAVPGKKIGLGLLVSRDQIAVVNQTNVYAAYAYRVPVARGSLSMGLQAGFSQFRADYSEVFVIDNDTYFQQNVKDFLPNVGAGLYYNTDKWYLGFSMPTLINGKVGDSNVSIIYQKRHYFLTGGYSVVLNPDLRLVPSFLMKMVGGSTVSWDFNSNLWIREKIGVGVSYRVKESVDLLMQFAVNDKLKFGYSFDYITNKTLSSLASVSHEFMIGYRIGKKPGAAQDTPETR